MAQLFSTLRNDGDGPDAAADARWLEVSDVVERLSAAKDFSQVAACVTSAARALVGADGATFVLREGSVCHYVGEDAIGPLWKGQRFPMSACISGWSMTNVTPAIVPDVYADPRIPVAAYEPTFVRSLVMVPIGPEPVGAIGAYWATKRSFDSETLGLLELLARVTRPVVSLLQTRAMPAIKTPEIGGLGAWIVETESAELSASPIFKQQLGRVEDEPLSTSDVFNQLHPEDREAFRASVATAADKGEAFSLTCRVTWPDGSVHWLDQRVDVLRNSRGVVTKLCGVSSSIDPAAPSAI